MFPEIKAIRKTSTVISVFRGLNRTANAGFSRVSRSGGAYFTELADMRNMSGCDYPRLRTRKPRHVADMAADDITVTSNLLAADGKLIYVANNRLYVGEDSYAIVAAHLYNSHTLTLYGNRIVIMPDRVVFDLESHRFTETDAASTTAAVSETELNVALFNTGHYNKRATLQINFRDFSIEKVMLDDSGKPRPVTYIYEKASGLEDPFKQTNPSGQNAATDADIEPWQEEYFYKWNQIRIGDTVEAQGESPSGVYLCTDIIVGGTHTIDGVTYNVNKNLRKFVRIDSTYVKISRKNSGTYAAPFGNIRKGDFVKLSGMTNSVRQNMVISVASGNSQAVTWQHNDWGNYLDVLNNNTFKVYYADADCIVIKASLDRSVPYTGALTVERVMPAVDDGMMLEVNNRLWTCSSANNELYSCRQGDPTNWQAYGDGISTDSYAATVGCEGVFTGIARQNDSVIFFKENWIIKLFGTKPGNYALATYNVPGVERGSEKSVVWINGVLFYLSHTGVCQYSPGGQPVVVSEQAFGDVKYHNGVAGRHRNKYYLSAQREDNNEWELLVLDTNTGLWHKEDGTQMKDCVTYNNVLYYTAVSEDGDDVLCCADDAHELPAQFSGSGTEDPFTWFFETPNLYEDDFGKKYISKLQIALNAGEDTTAAVYAQFRRDGAWTELRQLRHLERRHSLIPVQVRRSDFLKLRIEGTGDAEIGSIQIDLAGGTSKVWQY